MHVSVIGLGYVGLVTAACLASAGHRVRGTDASVHRVASLRAGRLPIFEPGLDALVADGVRAGRLTFDPDVGKTVAESDLVVVAVGTHDGNGGWQTRSITDCLRLVAEHARDGAVVAIRSTLPPDALDRLGSRARTLRASAVPGSELPIVLNPEFTREGSAVDDFLHPDRIVIGALDDPTGVGTSRVAELYAGFDAPILRMNAHDACLTKLASNLFLATKISFANELARLCDRFGARVDRVVEGMSLDPRIGGAFLRPGVGFGGSCLPHQVAMTVRSFTEDGEELPLLAAVQHVNEQQRTRFVALLDQLVEGLTGRRIALLGLTFKPGTDDLREAPSLGIAAALLDRGATVVAVDPMAAARERATAAVPGLETTDDPLAALEGADAAALVTEWPQFRALDWRAAAERMRRPIVVDGRNALDPEAVTAAGLQYAGFGRGFSAAGAPRSASRRGASPPKVTPRTKIADRHSPAAQPATTAHAASTDLEMAGHGGR